MSSAAHRVLLISPVRNEAEHLPAVAEGLLGQTRPPDEWIIVDDGSTDGTAEVLADITARVPFARAVATPPRYTVDAGDRNAAGGPDRAFNFGLSQTVPEEFSFVGKLDGDIVLPPAFLERLLAEFDADPQLGVAGGPVMERVGGEWHRLPTPPDQVNGAARLYRRECYERIGGMPPYMGADAITLINAKLHGYRTRTFEGIAVEHLKPMGSADGLRRGRIRQGAYQYVVHYHPLWVLARSLMVAARFRPYGLSGLWFLWGYLKAALGTTQRVEDPRLRAYMRREQRDRVLGAIRNRLSRRGGHGGTRVVMLLENNPYPQDVRVRLEAGSLTRAGYDVTVVAPRADGQPPHEVVDGVTVERFALPTFGEGAAGIVAEYAVANLQLYARGLRHLVRGADVVHMHNPPDTLFGVAWAARALGRSAVFDLHDIAPELFATKFGGGPLVRVLEVLERQSMRSASAAITTNESMRTLSGERADVPRERIGVVRNAPPAAMMAAVGPPRGGALTDPRLLFVGSIETQDGVDDLPEIVRLLRDEHGLPGVRLTVAGEGGRRSHVEELSRQLGVADSIEFLGQVPHARVAELLAQADVCLEPAPCTEVNHRCSMVKVYEYMAAGRPIVGYRLHEVTWMAGDDMTYVADDDVPALAAAVAQLAGDGDARIDQGGRLRRRAESLTWEHSERELLAAYASLGNGRAG